jgi:hypothetical protein
MAYQKTGSRPEKIKDVIFMSGREKDRKLRRRRRRRRKLRKLKLRLAQAKNDSERKVLVDKIRRISLTNNYVPEY